MGKKIEVSVELPDDMDKAWAEANNLAKKNGVIIEGDINSGNISFKGYKASYMVKGKVLTASCENVPFFVTEKLVKKEIEKWFNERK